MWIGAIGTAFAMIRSPELLLPMFLSKGCEASAAKPSDDRQMTLPRRNVKLEIGQVASPIAIFCRADNRVRSDLA